MPQVMMSSDQMVALAMIRSGRLSVCARMVSFSRNTPLSMNSMLSLMFISFSTKSTHQ